MADVVVIAGTSDGRQIINELLKLDLKVAATVTTGFGSELLNAAKGVEIYEGKLSSGEMIELLNNTKARCLIDASHPYAREASLNAMSACGIAGIPYLRFERRQTACSNENILRVGSFLEAANMATRLEGNILLTIGSNNIEIFTNNIPDSTNRVYARVLPESKVLLKCEAAGLSAKNIIALKGPFSEEMNIQLLKYCNAAILVTKDSGDAGGTAQKLSAAQKLGVKVILVERPDIDYREKTDSINEAVDFALRKLERHR